MSKAGIHGSQKREFGIRKNENSRFSKKNIGVLINGDSGFSKIRVQNFQKREFEILKNSNLEFSKTKIRNFQ